MILCVQFLGRKERRQQPSPDCEDGVRTSADLSQAVRSIPRSGLQYELVVADARTVQIVRMHMHLEPTLFTCHRNGKCGCAAGAQVRGWCVQEHAQQQALSRL
jgi:hypothetical protein